MDKKQNKIEYQKSLVELGLTRLISLRDKKEYFQRHNKPDYDIALLSLRIDDLEDSIDYTFEELVDARKLLNSMRMKNKRLRQRIDLMLTCSSNVCFCTFTLNEQYINYSKTTLEIYLKRILKDNCPIYIANADYGSQNERLHFHAVAIVNDIQKLKNDWKFGFSDIQVVCARENCEIKMAKYVSKLTNHALKDSTRPLENKLIYSRGVQTQFTNAFLD